MTIFLIYVRIAIILYNLRKEYYLIFKYQDAYSTEKKNLVEQNVSLKRWRETHTKEVQKLEKQVVDAQYEIQKISVGKADIENRIKILESQVGIFYSFN